MTKDSPTKLAIISVAALSIWAYQAFGVDEGCVTDSQCFIQCEKELGRPCTDEDVFGPAYEDGPCSDLPPDHPDHCDAPKPN
jgi:hypothetical protein